MEHFIKLVHNASRLVLPTNQSTVSAPRDTNQPIRAQYVCEKKHFIKLVRNASRHVQRSGEENLNIFIWIYSPQPLADLQGVLQFHNVVSSSAWIFFLWAVKLAEGFCSLGFSHLCLNSIFTSYNFTRARFERSNISFLMCNLPKPMKWCPLHNLLLALRECSNIVKGGQDSNQLNTTFNSQPKTQP